MLHRLWPLQVLPEVGKRLAVDADRKARSRAAFVSQLLIVPQSEKKFLYNSCKYAASFGHLPFSFTQRRVGMSRVAKALTDIGRTMQSSYDVDIIDLLPFTNTVR